jgi:mono/diheme cytochrome c family protein
MQPVIRTTTAAVTALLALAAAPNLTASESDTIARGQYLVTLLGCGRCHTEGYLTGDKATGPYLGGSRVGIAYTAYSMDDTHPGVVFAGNLTPDDATGLGTWSEEEIVQAMTVGVAKSGHERLTVMPWTNYGALKEKDVRAIARYLKSLSPVRWPIPEAIPEGDPIDEPYVRFGVYKFYPHGPVEAINLPVPTNEPSPEGVQ